MLKNFQSLKSRVAAFELDKGLFDYGERTVDEREDLVRVAFNQNLLPPIEDSVSFRKNYSRYSSHSIVIVVKPESFFLGCYSKRYSRGGNRIFAKEYCIGFVYVDSRRVNLRSFPGCLFDTQLGGIFLSLFGLEGFTQDAKNDFLIDDVLLNKSVVGGIVKGSITNWADAWKKYCKISFKIKSDFGLVEEYFRKHYSECGRNWIGFSRLVTFTNNWQKAVKVLLKSPSNEEVCLYSDLLEDAFLLNKKVDLSWSKKRCIQEHQRNIEEIMLAQESALSDEPIYDALVKDDTLTSEGVTFKILNTERNVFREASFMHNCIHSHYFPEISRGKYLVLSTETEDEGKIDIGYRWDGEKFAFEQIHTIRNGHVPDGVKESLLRKVEAFQQYLIGLHEKFVQQPVTNIVRTHFVAGEDLPF